MRLLVMGGTHHVGRAVVETALSRGDTVTTLNRGVSRPPEPGVEALTADRTDPESVRTAIGDRTWDAVIDTWALAPRVVRDTARLLADRVGHYGYVSSYAAHTFPWPPGLNEASPLVQGADPASTDDEDYPAAKRGGELAVLESFGDRALLARAGMILGPYDTLHRVTWWLRRLARGGRVLAPGPIDFPLQYIDGRDLAAWMLSAADRGLGGDFIVTGPPASTTIGDLLRIAREVTGSDAELVWAAPELLEREELWLGIELGMRGPGMRFEEMHADPAKALAAGLTCRPVRETVADSWDWYLAEGDGQTGGLADRRPDQEAFIDPDKERALLAEL
jgi:nucleoside-diphosphate-sugar epimerase